MRLCWPAAVPEMRDTAPATAPDDGRTCQGSGTGYGTVSADAANYRLLSQRRKTCSYMRSVPYVLERAEKGT